MNPEIFVEISNSEGKKILELNLVMLVYARLAIDSKLFPTYVDGKIMLTFKVDGTTIMDKRIDLIEIAKRNKR